MFRILDIETFSAEDLVTVGKKRYINSPKFEIDVVGWVDIDVKDFNDLKNLDLLEAEKNFKQWVNPDMGKHTFLPKELIEGFNNPDIISIAHNAPFEIASFEKILDYDLALTYWICTMVRAYQTGLPGGLSKISDILDLEYGKLKSGMALIKYFSLPCKGTKSNNYRERNYPEHDPIKWAEYLKYNKFDVLAVVEFIKKVLAYFPQPSFEHRYWVLDQKINKKGVRLDINLVRSAKNYIEDHDKWLISNLKEITKLENPNSPKQLKFWLQLNTSNFEIESINKTMLLELKEFLELHKDANSEVLRAIELRQLGSFTSLKKYEAVLKKMFCNGINNYRFYDFLQFYGTHTGRWAGRDVQIQNLPKNKLGSLKNLVLVRNSYINENRPVTDQLTFELSQLLRTLFIPDKGKKFMIADYSAIEARVAAWLADEEWLIETFREGKDPYKEMASRNLGIPINRITKDQRANYGKVPILACGFGGGVGAVSSFAPKDWTDDQKQQIVNYYRKNNPQIVSLWYRLNKAALHAVENRVQTIVKSIIFTPKKGCLLITLPSGRDLVYVRAKVERDSLGRKSLTYEYTDTMKRWGKVHTFGGKIFENIVQGIARDLLANALEELNKLNYDIVFHIHDEIIIQQEEKVLNEKSLTNFCNTICTLPKWCVGLPLKAEGFVSDFYMKDEE